MMSKKLGVWVEGVLLSRDWDYTFWIWSASLQRREYQNSSFKDQKCKQGAWHLNGVGLF